MTTIINASSSAGLVQTADTSAILQLQTGSTAALTVTASQNVGVGTTSPSGKLHSASTALNGYTFNSGFTQIIAESNTTAGISIAAGSAATGGLVFANSNGGSDGYMIYDNASRYMAMATAGSERMRINSTGSVGIGVTPNTWGNGNAVQLLGGSLWSYSNAYVDVLANSYWDGSVYKYVSNNPVSQFRQFGGQFIWNSAPTGTAGNTVSLVETMRLNTTGNLSLKGGTTTADGTGITFPATQSASSDANCLDDYEEGTWTPTLRTDGTQPTVGYAGQLGVYTKIGNRVYVEAYLGWNSVSGGSGSILIGGLPFTPGYAVNDSRSFQYLAAYSGPTFATVLMSIVQAGSTNALVYYNNNGTVASLTLTNAGTSGTFRMAFNYQIN